VRWAFVPALVAALLTACTSTPPPTPSPAASAAVTQSGGTLRVAVDLESYAGYEPAPGVTAAWDPQRSWTLEEFEIARCCLLRTLMSYNGTSVAEGGAELRPDLAADYPEISADGLTWRFKLKPDIHYAPPVADRTVVAADFVRAIERTIRPDPLAVDDPSATIGPYGFYLQQVISGADDFTSGKTSSISGLETEDPLTLVIHLVEPTGDLGARLAMPAAAPIPEGAADGHDADYALHQVATGPYMIEGSDALRPDLPVEQQTPVSGYVSGERLTLVRNPSWIPATDPLRTAHADRIEIVNASGPTLADGLLAGSVDLSLAEDLEPEDLARFKSDPQTSSRVHVFPALTTTWITMNVAQPPFDDIHVRRAVQVAVDKAALMATLDPSAVVQTHAIPDAFENDLLANYDPYPTSGHHGSIDQAKTEMAQSRYDQDHDGVCDDPACQGIVAPIDVNEDMAEPAARVAATLMGIGIQVSFEPSEDSAPYELAIDPTNHVPMLFALSWYSDYLNAGSWFQPLAHSTSIGRDGNPSLIGATDDQLKEWGYTATGVPGIDGKISACVALTGADQFSCWAEADQYLMERVAAWVPLGSHQWSRLTSERLRGFQIDASLGAPSVSEIQVAE
jgi:peptide/nickel transport system substrate-binding protein